MNAPLLAFLNFAMGDATFSSLVMIILAVLIVRLLTGGGFGRVRRLERWRNRPRGWQLVMIISLSLIFFRIVGKLALGFFAILLAVCSFLLWLWALLDCISRLTSADDRNRTTWIVWLLVILFAPFIGALVYMLVNHVGPRPAVPFGPSASTPPPSAPPPSSPPPAAPPPPPAPVESTVAKTFSEPFKIYNQPAPASASPAQPAASRPAGGCPKCGAPLPPDAPEGLCPRCLLQMNLGAPTQFPGTAAASFTTSTPPPPPAPEDIAKHFPQLEILECLGRGGMGVVYKARQPRLNRLVALKILAPGRQQDPQFADRFLREAQALARLSHPNIVTVYDFGESDGLYYLLMEYVDGVTLRGLLHGTKLEPVQALAIVPRICEALQYAHEQGVVHRDIKPENVLIDKQGRVKIADFGIARMLGVEGLPAHTRDRYVIGTPYYMAPEQVEKPLEVDHRADIYSLGVVFYEMLTGELPLGRFALPSQKVSVDVRLDDIVLRTLEKEPQRRYQHASEVRTDVENVSGVTTGTPAPIPGVNLGAPPPPRPPPPPSMATPPPPPPPPPPDLSEALHAVHLPGTLLCTVGIWHVICAVWWVVVGLTVAYSAQNVSLLTPQFEQIGAAGAISPAWIFAAFVNGMAGVVIICGAKNMKRLEHHTTAVVAAVVAFALNFFGMISASSRPDSDALSVVTVACTLAGAWAFVVLNRRKIVAAFAAQAQHAQALSMPPPVATTAETYPGESKFSRKAILGLLWAVLGIVAVVFIINALDSGFPQRMDGVALLLFSPFLAAPLGTTILGWTAAGEILRSRGRLHGLWLAVFDGLFFPLLALDGVITFLCYLATVAAWGSNVEPPDRYLALMWFAAVLLSLLADVLIVLLVAGAAHRAAASSAAPAPSLAWRIFKGLLIIGMVLLLLAAGGALAALLAWNHSARTNSWGFNIAPVRVNAPPLSPQLAKLDQAQQTFERVQQQFAAGLATQADIIDAAEQVEVLKAQLAGDPVAAAQARLNAAQQRRDLDEQLHNASLMPQTDYDRAQSDLAQRKAELNALQNNSTPPPPTPPEPPAPSPPGDTSNATTSATGVSANLPSMSATVSSTGVTASMTTPGLPGVSVPASSTPPLPRGYTQAAPEPRTDPDASVKVEISAIEKFDYENSKLASFLNIARRPNLSPAVQSLLVRDAYGHLDYENSKMSLLEALINRRDFSEDARTAILRQLNSLDFENNRLTILNLLNTKPASSSN